MNADRPVAELDQLIAATIANSQGTAPFAILARSPAEHATLTARLFRKHGAGRVIVKLETVS